ncbi:MAG: Twin arginine-targeting protein translocase, TatA/E family (modular protein) [Nitrospira sp.]|jgi:TatA/E family protein of Tat protein translocase|nr:Twin arginine-targeting protein translocase, TatA/E family (modular protein) [Nitrospira sp.]
MFGTMGFSELIIILVIVLIIFGAGKLPQIGEGVGKALKGFKKEVNDIPVQEAAAEQNDSVPAPSPSQAQAQPVAEVAQLAHPPTTLAVPPAPATPKATAPYTPGPELTPGTTAALMAAAGPQGPQATQPPKPRVANATSGQAASGSAVAKIHQPPTMEDRMAAPGPAMRAQYPPLPAGAHGKPVAKRPSAIVNKDAVARVQAAQAAMREKAGQPQPVGFSPHDMQNLGEGLGDAVRTFRQAVADVRNSVDPEMRTIRAEMDSAQKELEQSMEAAKQAPILDGDPPDKSI